MSKAEELLNSLDNSGIMVLSADASTEPHIIIGDDRFITVPDELKRLAVQYDHDVETVTFDCPRYWDEHDMSKWIVYINYRRPDKVVGQYCATNITTDADDSTIMHFDWTISKYVTKAIGSLTFNVCIKESDDEDNELHHWNSELCKDCYVSEGFELGDSDNNQTSGTVNFTSTQVYIGSNEVTAVPSIWFDTSKTN